ncbi:type VI secretion system contractile sheath large subunit [Bosea sp. BK604]|uniref:type VI secretion system contractile sheath domain-containing protein n=1 Tax=Bosea sp. BK604 TaxID=2512180 RepID=UPI001045497D|nr:type VI secretion system contractile sheath large subunit [Bosea sp. BK604]TCR68361.1 putative component of type VI protein secretion system [Bosea sp. BK604]
MTGEDRPLGGVHLNAGFGGLQSRTPHEVAAAPRFELLIVGDFGGESRMSDLTSEDIASALAGHGAVIRFDVPNHLGSEPPALAIALPVRSLRDLDPGTIAARVPEIVKAEAIAAEIARSGSVAGLDAEAKGPRFDKLTAALAGQLRTPRQAAAATAPAAAEDNSLDSLLSLVDVPGAPQQADPASAAISAFLSSTRGPQAAPSGASAARPDAVTRQIEAITRHPAWLTAEAAWRGLKLVLSARGRGTKPALKLWDLGGESITDALANDGFIGALAETAQEARWSAILVVGAFGTSAADFEALRHLALLGYASQTPVIVSLAAGFFGKPAAEVAAMDNPAALLDGPAHAAWRGLRDRPESQFLFAAWNDVVLRAGEGQAPLWGDAGLVVAAQILSSLSRSGWPTEILGNQNPVEGLDVVELSVRGGKTIALPLCAALDGGVARDLARDGLMALVGRADRDQAWLVRAAAVHQYGAVTDEMKAAMEGFAGLPFRFVSSLLESVSRERVETLPRGISDHDAALLIEQALSDLVQTTGPGAAVTVAPTAASQDGARAFEVSVTLGREVMGGFGFSFDIEA